MKTDSVQRRTNSPNLTGNQNSTGSVGDRSVTSKPPVLPRINCNSSFKLAFNRAGFRGLLQWIIRAVEKKGMSVQDRLNKPEQIKSAFACAFDQIRPSDEWRKNFKKILDDAVWFDTEPETAIHSSLTKLPLSQLKNLKLACEGSKSLAWVVDAIDTKLAYIEKCKNAERSRVDVERKKFDFLAKFSEFASLCGKSDKLSIINKKSLKEINELFDSFGTPSREINFEIICSKSSPAILLLFAEMGLGSISEDFPWVKNFCAKAIEKLKSLSEIDCSRLADKELIALQQLLNDKDMAHYASACEVELGKREKTKRIDELAARYQTRIDALSRGSTSAEKNNQFLSIALHFNTITLLEISSVAAKSISKMNPEAVVRLSKLALKSDDSVGNVLVNAAKRFLKKPDVESLDQKTLLAYLALPASAISADGRQRLVVELEKRATKCISARFKDLAEGLESDSFDSLVMGVREFSDKAISASKLEQAFERENRNGFQDALANARKKLSEKMEELNESAKFKITRARNLIVELREKESSHGLQGEMAKAIADRFSMEIRMANASCEGGFGEIGQTNLREIESIRKAISNHLPALSILPELEAMQSYFDSKLDEQFLNAYQSDFIRADQFGKFRTPEGEEIPVCAIFVRDQTKPTQAIYGEPVIKSHFPKPLDRTREFVRQMRNLGCTDEQIMMASRIASQSVGNALTDLVRNENLLPFLDGEIAQVGYNGVGQWLLPVNLSSYQNFARNENGTLIAKVRISNESISTSQGLSFFPKAPNVAISTNPENSSFLAELRFEIGSFGEIEKCTVENWVASREIQENLTLTH